MNRRVFLNRTLLGTGAMLAGSDIYPISSGSAFKQNKRERMLRWLEGKTDKQYFPSAFFLHFGNEYKTGSAAAAKHLEFFRFTDMDFVKIQYEQNFPLREDLKSPSDWSKLDPVKLDFFGSLLSAVREIVSSAKKDALIIMTLYSPYMMASQYVTLPLLRAQLAEDPTAVKRGLDTITESQMLFVRECIKIGVDGFYMSTQGYETEQFRDPRIFKEFIKPSDLVAMTEASSRCTFNILHVCDYNAPYHDYSGVADYPGQIVNCNPKLTQEVLSWPEISRIFSRPCMGGIDRHGIITHGTKEEIEAEVKHVLKNVPQQFILGADCTVPSDIDWNRLRYAISFAHNYSI